MWTGHTSLLTAHIIYRRPDHLWLVQDFIWQEYDALPDFPRLMKFLHFWRTKLDGPLVSVRVSHVLDRAQIITDLHGFEFTGKPN